MELLYWSDLHCQNYNGDHWILFWAILYYYVCKSSTIYIFRVQKFAWVSVNSHHFNLLKNKKGVSCILQMDFYPFHFHSPFSIAIMLLWFNLSIMQPIASSVIIYWFFFLNTVLWDLILKLELWSLLITMTGTIITMAKKKKQDVF